MSALVVGFAACLALALAAKAAGKILQRPEREFEPAESEDENEREDDEDERDRARP